MVSAEVLAAILLGSIPAHARQTVTPADTQPATSEHAVTSALKFLGGGAAGLVAHEGGHLLFDGIFLHRRELADRWDLSIFCRVDPVTSCARMAVRDGTPADPGHPANHRYVEGQRRYLADSDPETLATYVVDNTDLSRPYLVER